MRCILLLRALTAMSAAAQSDSEGWVKLQSCVNPSDVGAWKMAVYNPNTRQQVNVPIQVKIGNGPDEAHRPFWTQGGNFRVIACHHHHYGHPSGTPPMMCVWIKVNRPGIPVAWKLGRY